MTKKQEKTTQPEMIKIGRIVGAIALRGEVKIYNYSTPERFDRLEHVLIEGKDGLQMLEIERARRQNGMAVVKFSGIDDRNAAEALREKDVFITEDDLEELPEDTFYIRDLIGCAVIDAESGAQLGVITDVLQNTAQDIYQLKKTDGSEGMIPAVAEFIKEVDIAGRQVRVKLIPGLLA